MRSRVDPPVFLELARSLPIVDTRSPAEYLSGHIPGAINIPLFNDAERDAVGKAYKQRGRRAAVLEGLEYVGPTLASKLTSAIKTAPGGELLVYCWRGGMRSDSLALLFETGDLRPTLLEGGYKSYRNHILDQLAIRRKTLVLGGMTGSGKTDILQILEQRGEIGRAHV